MKFRCLWTNVISLLWINFCWVEVVTLPMQSYERFSYSFYILYLYFIFCFYNFWTLHNVWSSFESFPILDCSSSSTLLMDDKWFSLKYSRKWNNGTSNSTVNIKAIIYDNIMTDIRIDVMKSKERDISVLLVPMIAPYAHVWTRYTQYVIRAYGFIMFDDNILLIIPPLPLMHSHIMRVIWNDHIIWLSGKTIDDHAGSYGRPYTHGIILKQQDKYIIIVNSQAK